MPKSIHHAMIALSGALLLFVVACGTSSPARGASVSASSQAASLATVDWANFTYFTTCYQNTRPFHAQHSQAVNDHIHFYVYKPEYGDLTGDAQPEAVVPYQCSAADAMGVHLFIYGGTAAHPRLLGDLPPQNARGVIDNVTKITISNKELLLEGDGYSPSAPHCCPDLFIKTGYRWNGTTFLAVQSQVEKR
jgi:hypothetical protein